MKSDRAPSSVNGSVGHIAGPTGQLKHHRKTVKASIVPLNSQRRDPANGIPQANLVLDSFKERLLPSSSLSPLS